jgi:glycolate oxidase FAD binding subunit
VSTDAVVSTIKASGETRTPLRVAGGATWLDAGRPVNADKTLSVREDSGVVSYVPGDLTLTVRAGTPLSEIERVTREHDQWLPLDPYGSPDGTIGATIATASAGPLASSFGQPRDLVLGLEFVTGRGEVVRSGGKVVKNVAGFDLSRLLTGSWGTLGVITEVTLRLYALPQVDRTFLIALIGSEKQVEAVIRAIAMSPLAPFALQLISASAAQALNLRPYPVCMLRFGGNEAVVRAQVNALSQIGKPEETESGVWNRLRQLEGDAHTTVRISGLPRRFLAGAATIVRDDVPLVYTYVEPRAGLLRIILRSENKHGQEETATFGVGEDGLNNSGSTQTIFEKLPGDVWPSISPSVVSDPLSQATKRVYDPYNILNPGILGGLE